MVESIYGKDKGPHLECAVQDGCCIKQYVIILAGVKCYTQGVHALAICIFMLRYKLFWPRPSPPPPTHSLHQRLALLVLFYKREGVAEYRVCDR